MASSLVVAVLAVLVPRALSLSLSPSSTASPVPSASVVPWGQSACTSSIADTFAYTQVYTDAGACTAATSLTPASACTSPPSVSLARADEVTCGMQPSCMHLAGLCRRRQPNCYRRFRDPVGHGCSFPGRSPQRPCPLSCAATLALSADTCTCECVFALRLLALARRRVRVAGEHSRRPRWHGVRSDSGEGVMSSRKSLPVPVPIRAAGT